MDSLELHWQVPGDLPAFAGHFPGHPIVPGVVLLDRVMQLALAHAGDSRPGWQVAQAKFLHPCGPGDALRFLLRPGVRGGLVFSIHLGDREVASGSLMPPAP